MNETLRQIGLGNVLSGGLGGGLGHAASSSALREPLADGVTYAVRWYEKGRWTGTRWAADPGQALTLASGELHRLLFGAAAQADVSVEVVRFTFTEGLQMDCIATLRPPAKE